jgi:cell division septation protein DedD
LVTETVKELVLIDAKDGSTMSYLEVDPKETAPSMATQVSHVISASPAWNPTKTAKVSSSTASSYASTQETWADTHGFEILIIIVTSIFLLAALCGCCCAGPMRQRRGREAAAKAAEDIELQDRVLPNAALDGQDHLQERAILQPDIQAQEQAHEPPVAHEEPGLPPPTYQPLMEGETQRMQELRRQVYLGRTWAEVHDAMTGYAAEVEAAAAENAKGKIQSSEGEGSGSSTHC